MATPKGKQQQPDEVIPLPQSPADDLKDLRTRTDTTRIPGARPLGKWPWSFRPSQVPRETVGSYDKFKYWVSLGHDRTYKKVADHFGVTLGAISLLASKNKWKTRLYAYLDHKVVEEAEEERNRRHQEHLEKLEQFRNRSEQVGVGLVMASMKLLQAADGAINEMKKNGETLDRRLIAGALNASAKCAEAGRLLAAQSLGIDALIAGVEGAEGDPEEYG